MNTSTSELFRAVLEGIAYEGKYIIFQKKHFNTHIGRDKHVIIACAKTYGYLLKSCMRTNKVRYLLFRAPVARMAARRKGRA
jgi:hypothetical protein